jgi:hypothetical protein
VSGGLPHLYEGVRMVVARTFAAVATGHHSTLMIGVCGRFRVGGLGRPNPVRGRVVVIGIYLGLGVSVAAAQKYKTTR